MRDFHNTPPAKFKRVTEIIAGIPRVCHQITCAECGKDNRLINTEVVVLPPQAVAQKFRLIGWHIGFDRRNDLCGACGRRPASPPQPKPKELTMTLHETPTPTTEPPPSQRALAAVRPRKPGRKTHAYDRVYPPAQPGKRAKGIATRGFLSSTSAAFAAVTYLARAHNLSNPKPGRDYLVVRHPDGYGWSLPGKTLIARPPAPVQAEAKRKTYRPIYAPAVPGQKRQPFYTRGFAAQTNACTSAREYLRRTGIAKPHLGEHFSVHQASDQTWDWDAVDLTPPKENDPMTGLNGATPPTPTLNDIAEALAPYAEEITGGLPTHAQATALHAEPPKPPTPAARRVILEALDQHYLSPRACYRSTHSDRSLSELLSVPQAWVREVREYFAYGPDTNEKAALQSEADKAFVAKAHELETKANDLALAFATLRRQFEQRVMGL